MKEVLGIPKKGFLGFPCDSLTSLRFLEGARMEGGAGGTLLRILTQNYNGLMEDSFGTSGDSPVPLPFILEDSWRLPEDSSALLRILPVRRTTVGRILDRESTCVDRKPGRSSAKILYGGGASGAGGAGGGEGWGVTSRRKGRD